MKRGTVGLGLLAVLFIFLLVLAPLPVHASSTLVQQKEGDCRPCTTLPISFTATSGDVVVVSMLVTPSLTSITDSLSSSFTQAASFPCDGGSTNCYIYYATLVSSGADTITITIPSPNIGIEAYVYEVSGVVTPPIVTAVSSGASNQVSTASTTFQSGAFILGTLGDDDVSSPFTAGSGFTLSPNGGSFSLFEEYSTSAVLSPTTFPATYTSTQYGWNDVGLVLNPAPTPPIPEYPLGLSTLAILTILGYGFVRRRTQNNSR